MEASRSRKMMLRLSLLTAAAIAAFWLTYYLFYGFIPQEGRTCVTQFSISRWWDILIGPIFSVISVQLARYQFRKESPTPFFLAVFIIISLCAFLSHGLVAGFVICTIAWPIVGALILIVLISLLGAGILADKATSHITKICELTIWPKIGNWILAK